MATQTAVKLETFWFVLTLAGVDEMTDELQGALLKQGCDDALLGKRAGKVHLSFAREATDLADAIGSAIKAVLLAGYSVSHIEVERP
jgi:hypothetical protein